MRSLKICLLVVACCSVSYADRQLKEFDSDINYDETKVPHYVLPSLLTSAEGRPITTAEQWIEIRRPQIMALFSNLIYGRVPVPQSPIETDYRVLEIDDQFMNGAATLKTVRIEFSNDYGKSSIKVRVVTPNSSAGPVPAMMKIGSGPVD